MRRLLALTPLLVCALWGCTQILALDSATVEPSEDALVPLPLPDGVAVDSFLESGADTTSEAFDVLDAADAVDAVDAVDATKDAADGKPAKDSD